MGRLVFKRKKGEGIKIANNITVTVEGIKNNSVLISVEAPESVKILRSEHPRFANVFCSSCGQAFGPGDHGFSHCEDHQHLTPLDVRS